MNDEVTKSQIDKQTSPFITVESSQVLNAESRPIVSKARIVGRRWNATEGRQRFSIQLMIPISAASRRKKIEKYIDAMDKKERNRTDPRILDQFRRRREEVVASLERVYVQNVVGLFQLKCVMRYRQAAGGSLITSSPPIRVRIRNEGDFLDKYSSGFPRK